MSTRDVLSRRRSRMVQLLAAVVLLVGLFGLARDSEARLDPFYIVRGQSYGELAPRILFVVDTSGSMSFEQPWPDTRCTWEECESQGPGRSRIHVAREVIQSLVAEGEGTASFSLMTFGMAAPPQNASQVPEECYSWDWDEWERFTWIPYTNQPYNGWTPLTNAFGGEGTWVLCGDNRPFPYLRHDDLGGFSLPNNSSETLADAPLYTTKSTYSAFKSGANYDRKVQWFPRYMGRRVNLDCSDDQQHAIAKGTYGDWGNNNGAKNNNVCGRDFYYWPYVDGYPGYSHYSGYSANSMWHIECDDQNDCWSTNSRVHRLGVNRRNYSRGATLYAPFYSKAVLESNAVDDDEKGPLDDEDAALMIEGLTAETYAGGLDVSGGTPWATAIGNVDSYVSANGQGNFSAKGAMNWSNAAFSHRSVASYLSFLTMVSDDDVCRPTSAILLTDGQPSPWSSEGGSKLYQRVRKLRSKLGVKTYLVGFSEGSWNDPTSWSRMHHFACAAAGSNNNWAPCNGTSNFDWDTCRDPEDPGDGCAWLAGSSAELSEALSAIIAGIVETDVPGGAPTVANDFSAPSGGIDDDDGQAAVQTSLEAYTRAPAWLGHVVRSACSDEDPENPGQLAEYCQNAIDLPLDSEEQESFGPCPLGRVWDAGECLQQTPWAARRLYTHGFDNELIRIAESGTPTPEFVGLVTQLNSQGKIDPPLTPGNESAEIKAMVELVHGATGPDEWKLPGLANSAPILIRRVPRYNANFLPSVGIRDPHCAGRRNVVGDNIPSTLQAFASSAWDLSTEGGFAEHYEYAEAVLVGDDFGLLHAFHYDSGNELFGFLPLALVNNARVLSVNAQGLGFGQPEDLSQRVYGIASTVNAGWAYDEETTSWRHLAVFGLGPGGSEILALDVSHMARLAADDPVDVLWTSSTSELAGDYADTLGETWSRPALTYAVPGDEMSLEPKAYLVFGSGYREGVGDPRRGRVVYMVDALTGSTTTNRALVSVPPAGSTYDALDDVAAISDIAVGSHCLSRYWGEMQEAYWADPAGRLYRWDLGADFADVDSFPHLADSGGTWPEDGDGFALATPAFRFPACQGTAEFNCSVGSFSSPSTKGDVFTYSPAVVAARRIDDIDDPGDVLPAGDRDQFLIALASGSPNDDAVDGGDEENDFHSSIYLLVDDHREEPEEGFTIPDSAPPTPPGAESGFMRLPLSQIERTREVQFPDGSTESQTRVFSKRARPIRPPMIRVTGVAEGDQQLPAEVFYVTYTIYEPGGETCDSRWYDEAAGEWVFDAGATYEISFRLSVADGDPFDFLEGFALPADPSDGFGTAGSLVGPIVQQVGSCPDGNCGAVLQAPKSSPCDPNDEAPGVAGAISVQTGWSELEGFSPLEVPL